MMSPANRILAALPGQELARLARDLEPVELKRRQVAWSAGEALQHVYFPESGAVALVSRTGEGTLLETGLVGSDGVVGLEAFFNAPTAQQQAVVLLPGTAHRIPVQAFAPVCASGTALHEVMQRFVHARMVALAQSAACDATHSIRHRCVRRLLALHDYAGADHFPLTQQVLAALLGVRRASVSVAAEKLQAAGVILYEHGRMHVADRVGLEKAACACYQQMKLHWTESFSGC